MRRFILTALVLAAASPAFAQPSLTPISDPENPPAAVPHQAPAEPSERSETTATTLAIGTTLGGVALAVAATSWKQPALGSAALAAFFIGPSAGHIYAGEGWHAVGMSLLRTGAFVTFIYGVIEATTVVEADIGPSSGSPGSTRDNGVPLMILGGAAFVAATGYDLYDAHRAARRANAQHHMAITPMTTNHGAGLVLAGTF